MVVLVGYATKHGSTRGVAERIAARLREHGLGVDVRALRGTEDAAAYDAVVFGSAVYSQAWLAEAVEFARRNADVLADRPVWTFTVGRLHDQRGLLRRVTWPDAKDLGDVRQAVHPRDHRFFSGAIDRARLSRAERLIFKTVGGRYGDFRNWPDVDAWADGVAQQLSTTASASSDGST